MCVWCTTGRSGARVLATGYNEQLPAVAKEWRALVAETEATSMFKTRASFYVLELAKCAAILVASIALVCRNRNAETASTMAVVGAGALLGAFWQQVAFVGHDVGHNSVRGIRSKSNYHLGIVVGNILTGVSIGWWKSTHNVHHVVCNSATHDPDIQHLPLLCVSEKIFNVFSKVCARASQPRGRLRSPLRSHALACSHMRASADKRSPSQYHNRTFALDRFARLAVMAQFFTYYPVMCIARFNLYAQGLVRLIKERKSMTRYQEFTEWLGIALFVSWYAGVVSLLPTAGLRATYALVATACCALLHDQIALSHWSRPIFSGKPTHFSGWFEHQLSGTLNITCPTWMDWVHGGLQFQIEHHLFPRLPRHNLRMVKPLVEKFARRHGVQYHDIGFVAANKEVLQAMWDTGLAAKAYKH